MKRLKVSHFLQDPSYCAVAAAACVANYYNPLIDYEFTKKKAHLIDKNISENGLDSGQIGLLLNQLGFYKVTIISSVFDIFDYTWAKYKRKKMIETLYNAWKTKKDKGEKELTRNLYKWYKNTEYDNRIIIDYDFQKYICYYLNKKEPIIASFNWTMFFKFSKENQKGYEDVINGTYVEHSVVINGCDNRGVWICDSHHKFYKYKRKKYRKGFYKIPWNIFLTCMGQGDVIVPEEYIENRG